MLKDKGATAKTEAMLKALEGCNQEKLREWLARGDGHTVYLESFFLEDIGLPKCVVGPLAKRHDSNPDNPKEVIFNDRGEPLLFVMGVYGLYLLRTIGDALGVVSTCMGRGWEAREIGGAILTILDEVNPLPQPAEKKTKPKRKPLTLKPRAPRPPLES